MRLAAMFLMAVSLASALAQSNPTQANAPTLLDTAETLIEQREFAKARQSVMQALTAHPDDTRALYDLGFIEFATDHRDAAEQDYRRVIELAPNLPQAHLALGRLLADTRRAADAREQFSAVANNSQADVKLRGEAWRELARQDFSADPEQARQDLIHALEATPEMPADTLLAGQIAESLHDGAAAEQAYRKMLQQSPKDADGMAALGRLLLREKRYPEAVNLLQSAHGADPDNPVVSAQLASALVATGKPAEATTLVEQAHAADPSNAAVTRLLADLDNENGHPAEAESLYVMLLKQEPKDAQVLAAYGASLIRQQRYFEAVPPLQQSVTLNPQNGDAWGSLAFAHSKIMRFDDVLADLTQRKKYLPENASTYFLWATAYDKLRHTKEAKAYYQLFLSEAGGKFPDQEFQVRHRLAAMEHK